jgi:hypothetical protein
MVAGRFMKRPDGDSFTLFCEDMFGSRLLRVTGDLWDAMRAENRAPDAFLAIVKLAEHRPRYDTGCGVLEMPIEALGWAEEGFRAQLAAS